MTQLDLTKEVHEVHPSALLPILTVEKEKKSASIVIQSRRTSKDYTFKISRSEWHGVWYTHIWIEKGYDDYEHMGDFRPGERGLSSRIFKNNKPVRTEAARAITWVLLRVYYKHWARILDEVQIMHSGRCLACGRKLTDAESIKRGVGPVCAEQGRS